MAVISSYQLPMPDIEVYHSDRRLSGAVGKGQHVYPEGRLQTRKWKGPEGDKRTAIEVVANQMQILDRAPTNGNGAKAAKFSKPGESVDEGDSPFNEPGSETTDPEIPF